MTVENTGQQASQPLRVFLCHASDDKEAVRDLYARLLADGFAPWLDEEALLPGQEWRLEVQKAVRGSDAVIVCVSPSAVTKRGYVQKEIRLALDVADEQPEGAIFVIPVRLDECKVPERLKGRQWVDLFSEDGYETLRRALLKRAEDIGKSAQPGQAPSSAVRATSDADTFKVLGDWMAESRRRWSNLVGQVADEEPAYLLPHGLWQAGYMVEGEFEQPSLRDLMSLLKRVQGHESGWPPWWVPTRDGIRPYPYGGHVECWLGRDKPGDPGHADFWRASPLGRMYLLRGYREDGSDQDVEPASVLWVTLPVLRVGECLLHAHRLGRDLAGDGARVVFRAAWEGLSGRLLKNRQYRGPEAPRTQQDAVVSDIIVSAADIPSALPDIVERLTLPLYEAFNFERPPTEFFQKVLKEMWKPHGEQ